MAGSRKSAIATLLRQLSRERSFHLFVGLGILFTLLFSYLPMAGILMAFKDYRISDGIGGIFTSAWVGLKNFRAFFQEIYLWPIVRNTLLMSLLKIAVGFPFPILFALMLNEIRNVTFKRITQTVSYLPHFVSWVVVSGILFTFLSVDVGVLNGWLVSWGLVKEPIAFLSEPRYFYGVAVVSEVWKESGWWSVIYLAAIASIDVGLYEAAQLDGATRLQRARYITIPGMKAAIGTVLILSVGNLLGGGLSGSNFEQSLLLGNALNSDRSLIIGTYVLRVGLVQARYAYAAAVGLLQSVLSLAIILGSNAISRRTLRVSLF